MSEQGFSAKGRLTPSGGNGHGRPSSRRSTAVALAVSTLFHVGIILVYSVATPDWNFEVIVPVGETPGTPVEGTRLVRIVELPPDDAIVEAPEDPDPEPKPEAPATAVPTPESGIPTIEDVPPGVRASQVLRIRSADPRLWRAAAPAAHELSEEERMQLELAGRLETWNDSVRALVASENALTDWTVAGESGERWGISPGKLHLGKLTLPLPFGFAGNAWQRERAAQRAFEDADIRNGAAASFMAQHWKERVEAIRRRRDREREKEKSDSTKADPGNNLR